MSVGKTLRLLRTLSHLRPSQLVWRARYVAERRLPPRPGTAPPTPLPGPAPGFPEVPLFHRPGLSGEPLLDELAAGRLTQLNRTVQIDRDEPDWHLGPRARSRLWTITLHYHAWAYGLAEVAASDGPRAAEARELLEHYVGDWIERCDLTSPGARDLAWNSFAIATRIGWWVRALNLLGPQADDGFATRIGESLWRQADHLHRHLEWDLRGNHLLRDLVGLAWAGRYFDDPRADEWLRSATALAADQVAAQLLPDGAHYERSPMYHIHVMEDVASLALLLRDESAVRRLTEAWKRMADYLAWLRYPDDRIPLLNDGGLRAVSAPGSMLALGQRLGRPVDATPKSGGRLFPDAGLVVWHGEPWIVFFDVGRIGADEVPGHAHADTLTFECSYRGHPLFVDPGSFGYDRDERRRADRSTAAHNTVCIDETDSSEVWHIFRVGRRAVPVDVRAEFRPSGFEASAAHTGYRHLPGRPCHRRRLVVGDDAGLVLVDRVEGRGGHRLRGSLLVAPAWSVEPAEGGWRLFRDGQRLNVRVESRVGLRLGNEPATFHPEYGLEQPTQRLRWSYEGELPVEVRTEVSEA